MPQDDPDELWDLRNQYYVGYYEGVVSEASSVRIDDSDTVLQAERDLFLQLANLAQGEDITPSRHSGPEFVAVEHFANLLNGADDPEEDLAALKGLVEADGSGSTRLRMLVGLAFWRFGADPNDALRILHSAGSSLEALHVSVSVLLSMDRLDLASKTLERMQSIDEDSTLTQLAGAWLDIATNTEASLRNASDTLEQLTLKWQATPLLVGGLSCVKICQGRFADADKVINDCEGEKTSDLYVNSIVSAQHEGRRLDEFIAGLKQLEPAHSFFSEMTTQSGAFDEAAKQFSI